MFFISAAKDTQPEQINLLETRMVAEGRAPGDLLWAWETFSELELPLGSCCHVPHDVEIHLCSLTFSLKFQSKTVLSCKIYASVQSFK